MLQELMLTRRTRGGAATVTVAGELDAHTAPDLAEALGDQLQAHVRDLLIDVSGITFISAAGLHVLTEATSAAAGQGVRVQVQTGESRVVRRILHAAGGEHLLPLAQVPQPA